MATNRTLCSSQWVGFWTYSGGYRSDEYITITADVERDGNVLYLSNIIWNVSVTGSMRWSGGISPVKTTTFRYYYNGSYHDLGYAQFQMPTHSSTLYFSGSFSNVAINISNATDQNIGFNVECEDGPQYFSSDIPYYVIGSNPYINLVDIQNTQLTLKYGLGTRPTLNSYGTITYPNVAFRLSDGVSIIDNKTLNASETTCVVTGIIKGNTYTYTATIGARDSNNNILPGLDVVITETIRTGHKSVYFGKIIHEDGTWGNITSFSIINTGNKLYPKGTKLV